MAYEWPHARATFEKTREEVDQCIADHADYSLNAEPLRYDEREVIGEAEQIAGMPYRGTPGSWASSMPGKMPQLRQYGRDGTPLTDFDLEAHHGNSNPHAHNWVGGVRDEGAPVSLLPW
ncbi:MULTISPECIES: hypothetical protein [unclassified Caballeronia]|uniref:hypothetical protein n=1 Tax=unclassified Caballeronia TaxID=2646786 RepID=UPI0028610780|nr:MULTISPECIES: hypothetical protein [unclassified Caballeronia]MDR5736516.1 hypothetical protein [Caballeronia sp. LZ016]MDR5811005.1 hypothetical protein [Caballeronia sp. LZ019]